MDSLDLSLNRSSSSNSSRSNNQQAVYSDRNQNLRGRDCLGQRPRPSHNNRRDSKEAEDCLGRIQGRGRQVLEEGCLDQRSSSNSLRLEVDCLEVRWGRRGRWGRVREDCLDSRTKPSQNLREGCLEVLLCLRLAAVDFLDQLCNNPNRPNNSNNNRVSLGRLRSLLRLEGCLDQQLNNSSRSSSSSSSKVEGCLGTLDSHKPSLRVVCLALAHLVLHNNHHYNRKAAACSDPLLGSLPIRLASFSNPRLFSRVCSRACLV